MGLPVSLPISFPCLLSVFPAIVKASSGPRYVVGCRRKVDRSKLVPGLKCLVALSHHLFLRDPIAALCSGARVALDMTTLTIMRILPREVDPTGSSSCHITSVSFLSFLSIFFSLSLACWSVSCLTSLVCSSHFSFLSFVSSISSFVFCCFYSIDRLLHVSCLSSPNLFSLDPSTSSFVFVFLFLVSPIFSASLMISLSHAARGPR